MFLARVTRHAAVALIRHAPATPAAARATRLDAARAFSGAQALCRKRRKTDSRNRHERCPECPGPPEHPLCYNKRSQCLDPHKVPKCPPLRKCKNRTCEFVDPRKMAERHQNEYEDEQMAQAREERRLRLCHTLKATKCCKKKKKYPDVYRSKCPKDYSDPRHCK